MTTATDISGFDNLPEAIPAPSPARPRLLLIATALTSVAIAMGFAGLLGIYIETRAEVIQTGERWLPGSTVIPLTQPNMMAITLLLAGYVIAWAVSSIRNDDQGNTNVALGLTLMLGFAYLAQSAYLMTIMELPAAGDTLARPTLLYALVAAHMILVVAAMAFVAGTFFRTVGGNYSSRDVEGLYALAFFWGVTIVLYLAVWYAIYITK
ncbi:MAG: cytochrome c oxidase subunit 3 [Acidimicrobiales bacterium]